MGLCMSQGLERLAAGPVDERDRIGPECRAQRVERRQVGGTYIGAMQFRRQEARQAERRRTGLRCDDPRHGPREARRHRLGETAGVVMGRTEVGSKDRIGPQGGVECLPRARVDQQRDADPLERRAQVLQPSAHRRIGLDGAPGGPRGQAAPGQHAAAGPDIEDVAERPAQHWRDALCVVRLVEGGCVELGVNIAPALWQQGDPRRHRVCGRTGIRQEGDRCGSLSGHTRSLTC